MQPVVLFVLVVFLVLVLIVLLAMRKPGGTGRTDIEEQTFEFQPDTDQSAAPFVGRRVRIVAPSQMLNGAPRKLQINLLPLPKLNAMGAPPPEKHIDALVALALNPQVRDVERNEDLVNFAPPLRVTVYYSEADAQATTLENGAPQLSIVTAYESDGSWRYERLETVVTPAEGGGTLDANLSTLQPDDPIAMGRP